MKVIEGREWWGGGSFNVISVSKFMTKPERIDRHSSFINSNTSEYDVTYVRAIMHYQTHSCQPYGKAPS